MTGKVAKSRDLAEEIRDIEEDYAMVALEIRDVRVSAGICPRCQKKHDKPIEVNKLAGASAGSYFYLCPENQQPVFVTVSASGE